jgi:hypothetical protein
MPDDPLKQFDVTQSKRPSILKGAKHIQGFVIRPEQMLELFRDTMPALPIPRDAQHCGLGIKDEGRDSKIQFFFTSNLSPFEHCFEMAPELFLKTLVGLADGLLPLDSELDGIEISHRFTVLMLRVKSDHFPPHPGNKLPLVHLRYDLGCLLLVDPAQAIGGEKRIRIQ